MMTVLVATRNKNKFKEIARILRNDKIRLLDLNNFKSTPAVIEDKDTFRANAIKKALIIAKKTGMLTIADDSGLEVGVLGGRPGVYSSRFAGPLKKDLQNNIKLLKMLTDIPLEKRRAHFVCSVAIADSRGLIKAVDGRCRGFIGYKRIGHHGFGYDPIFVIPKYKKTFAQLGPQIKDKISHRAVALRKAKKMLLSIEKAS